MKLYELFESKNQYYPVEADQVGDAIQVLVMHIDSAKTAKPGYQGYNGINVLFKKDGSIGAIAGDPLSKSEWENDKPAIIKAARPEFLKHKKEISAS